MKNNRHLLCVDSIYNKKVWWLSILFLIFAFSFLHPQSYLKVQAADGDIAINSDNFPDDNFRDYLLTQTYGVDGELTAEEIGTIKDIEVPSKEISSLKGIEYFTSLTELHCYDNQLTSLDVSANTKLTGLYCYFNQLTSLDVSTNTELTRLYCDSNRLTSLDVSTNTGLIKLYCSSNQLTSLDVSDNTQLIELSCNYNQLTSLGVSTNTDLELLFCMNNQLTSLDVSSNTRLIDLYCSNNQLTSLDVSNNTNLNILYCSGNELASLDVSTNTNLTGLYCSSNQLTSLDVSNNTTLVVLDCSSNQLTSLDVSNNTTLGILYCNYNEYIHNTDLTNRINVADLPGNFDIQKADEWTGAIVEGTNAITATGGVITYRYECGNGHYKTFTLIPEVQISYQLNGGNNHKDNPTKCKAADSFDLKKPTQNYYTFAGWYSDASFKTKVTSLSGEGIVSRTLYAKWTPNQYTVTFDARKGTVSTKTKNVVYNAQYGSLPTPKRTGYRFQGWYTKSSGGSKITDSKKVTITKGQTLYARWEAKQYTLKFNAGKGKVSQKTKKITYDAKYGSLPNPKRAGYSFQGWYTKSSGGSKITSSKKVTVTKGQTLYSRWKKVSVAKVTISSIKNSSPKKAVLSLKKVSGASGYQVVYADNKNFKKAKKTDVSGTKVTLKKLTKGKTWHVKVRAYKKDSAGKKVYGSYSSVKKIKIKK